MRPLRNNPDHRPRWPDHRSAHSQRRSRSRRRFGAFMQPAGLLYAGRALVCRSSRLGISADIRHACLMPVGPWTHLPVGQGLAQNIVPLSAGKLLAGAPPVENAELAKVSKRLNPTVLARALTGNDQSPRFQSVDPFEQRVSTADHRPRGLCQVMDSLREI